MAILLKEGQVVNQFTVKKTVDSATYPYSRVLCRCSCGNMYYVKIEALLKKSITCCGNASLHGNLPAGEYPLDWYPMKYKVKNKFVAVETGETVENIDELALRYDFAPYRMWGIIQGRMPYHGLHWMTASDYRDAVAKKDESLLNPNPAPKSIGGTPVATSVWHERMRRQAATMAAEKRAKEAAATEKWQKAMPEASEQKGKTTLNTVLLPQSMTQEVKQSLNSIQMDVNSGVMLLQKLQNDCTAGVLTSEGMHKAYSAINGILTQSITAFQMLLKRVNSDTLMAKVITADMQHLHTILNDLSRLDRML